MTAYRFRTLSAAALFVLLAFLVLAFGGVDLWALTIFEIGVFVLAAVWAVRIARGSLQPVWNPFYLPWGLLAAWTGVQYAFGLSVHRYRTEAQALKWLALWLLLVMAAHVFTDPSIRRRFNLSLAWFAFALCVFGLVQYFTSRNVVYWAIPIPVGKIFGPFIDANHFVTLMELIIPMTLVLALRRSEQQVIYVVVANLILTAVVVCASRAGTALVALETAIVLGVTTLAPRRPRRSRQGRRLLLPLAGLAAVATFSFFVAGSQQLLERFHEEQPYALRWSVARATWHLFLSRPFTGYGAGTFAEVYPSAAPFDEGVFWEDAHNDPVQFAMEWGVIGLAVLVWTLCLLLRRNWPREVWLTLVLPLLIAVVHSWFDFPMQIPAVAAAWLLLLAQVDPAAEQAAHREARAGRPASAAMEPVPARVETGK
ncbi:MAG TPA: O-antigen ligase family protein [Bryobacterales bacterium]|nr:O-antigen ligase family protein [Bryobacterales bacterium]